MSVPDRIALSIERRRNGHLQVPFRLSACRPLGTLLTMEFAVFDTETTGLGSEDRIVEIAVLVLNDELVPQGPTWQTLVNPGGSGPVGASHIHGIVRSDLDGAPSFDDVAEDLAGLFEGRVLVAHNLKFDRRMLMQECERTGRQLGLDGPSIDTLRVSWREGMPGRLGALASYLGVPPTSAHRAAADVATTVAVLQQMTDRGLLDSEMLDFAWASQATPSQRAFDAQMIEDVRFLRRRRGRQLASNGSVDLLESGTHLVQAFVRGSAGSPYLVRLTSNGQNTAAGIPLFKPRCTCPDDALWCKHALATAYVFCDRQDSLHLLQAQ